jgi:hypothetical protein
MWTIGISITLGILLSSSSPKCQTLAALQSGAGSSSSSSSSSSFSQDSLSSSEPIRIKMLAPAAVSKKHTRTRQNSRFLRTFPPMELLNLAKQSAMNNEIAPLMSFPSSGDSFSSPSSNYHHNPYQSHNRNSLFGGSSPPFMPTYEKTYPMKARIDAGNSPIFYIKLPPVPYVFMPGVGYISPHPYSSNSQSFPMGGGSGEY